MHAADLCRLRPAVFTAVGSGLRRGEDRRLIWPDVNVEPGMRRVRQTRVVGLEELETDDPKTTEPPRRENAP